ncbi:hypothetical protein SNE40_004658 [Patella caerulea]|uniref:Uncharacterized protein n=1 Tax=Patella caerulea TaxID=87958 RepID=A0AAN8K9U1_PATCE
MATLARTGSAKEVGAVTYNLKEQRYLEKSIQSLSIEQNYSLKLLELNHRVLRVNHRKLKDRVNRIKSNLSIEDIVELRHQESVGRFKPVANCLNLGSASKIAAASRRLNLGSVSDRPDVSQKYYKKLPKSAPFQSRRYSVSGEFASKRDDIDISGGPSTSVGITPEIIVMAPTKSFMKEQDNAIEQRPHTTDVSIRNRRSSLRPSTQSYSANHHCSNHSLFSSHSALEKELKCPSRASSIQKLPTVVDDSIESNLGENLFEERRQDMLYLEAINSDILKKRQEVFLQEVENYLKHSKAAGISESDLADTEDVDGATQPEEKGSRRRVGFDGRPPAEIYKERLLNLWKGLNKCRYLRVPDSVMDLSGITTLARDQFQLNSFWKHNPESPVN